MVQEKDYLLILGYKKTRTSVFLSHSLELSHYLGETDCHFRRIIQATFRETHVAWHQGLPATTKFSLEVEFLRPANSHVNELKALR